MKRPLQDAISVEHLWELPVDTDKYVLVKHAHQTEQWREAEQGAKELLAETLQRARGHSPDALSGGSGLIASNNGPQVTPGYRSTVFSSKQPTVLHLSRLLLDIFYMAGQYDGCLAYCEQALQSGALPPNDCFADLTRGWVLNRRNQVTAAYNLAVSRLSRNSDPMPPEVAASYMHLRGFCELRMGRVRLARRHLQDAVALCRAAGDKEIQIEALNCLGRIEILASDLPSAMSRLEEASQLSHKLGKSDRRAQSLLNIAVLLTKSGHPGQALELLDGTPEVRHMRNNHKRRLMIQLTRAKAMLEMDRGQEAREVTRPVLGEAVRRRFPRVEVLAWEVLGDCALAEGRVRKARRYYECGLALSEHTVAGYMAAGADLAAGLHRRKGQAALVAGDVDRAVAELRSAVQGALGSDEQYEEGISRRLLARTYRVMDQFDRAYETGRRAIKVLRGMGADLELARALLETAKVQFAWWQTDDSHADVSRIIRLETGHVRGHLEAAWSYVVEAVHGFEELEREEGKRECLKLMERMRAEADPPWRERPHLGLTIQTDIRSSSANRGSSNVSVVAERANPSCEPVEFVAHAPATRQLLGLAMLAASSSDPVLVTGETGTGKELISRLIHEQSKRKEEPWVPVNCAAIPEALFEREFFGHQEGAFTGAQESRPGLCEKAHGGTLLLDEVGEMPLPLQAKLLRLLQWGTYRRLGDSEERWANLRIIAVTNADLQAHIATGRFREDLFYRLSVYQLHLPPLRDRREDIDPLIALTIKRYVSEKARPEEVFDAEVLRILRRYFWYGNVRELEAVTKQLATMARHLGRVTVRMLPPEFRSWADRTGGQSRMELAAYVEQAERDCISRALVDTKGNRTEAARLLGISRNTIYKKMERLGIRFPT